MTVRVGGRGQEKTCSADGESRSAGAPMGVAKGERKMIFSWCFAGYFSDGFWPQGSQK